MQNKKSVVFLVPENMLPQARSIRKTMVKDSPFAGIVVSEKKLRCLIKNFLFDKLAPEGSRIRKNFKKYKKKISRDPENMTFGDWCGLPKKTVGHLLYRFVPDVVVVSTEEALRSIFVERKKTGVKCNLCVLCGEDPTADIVDERVDCYFVAGLTERNKLIGLGVDAEKIVMGIAGLSEQRSEEDIKNEAKATLGVKKRAVVFLAEEANEEGKERLKDLFAEDDNEDAEYLFYCGEDAETAEFVSENGGHVLKIDEKDCALTAADFIVSVPGCHLAEELDGRKKKIVDMPAEGSVGDFVVKILDQIKPAPTPKTNPNLSYAEYLKNLLEAKMNAEPIEQEEETEEEYTVEKDEDDDE